MRIIIEYDDGIQVELKPTYHVVVAQVQDDDGTESVRVLSTKNPQWIAFAQKLLDIEFQSTLNEMYEVPEPEDGGVD